MRALIVGCGYVGLEVGRILAARGVEVVGFRRGRDGDALLAETGIRPFHGDLTRPEDLAAVPGGFDWVVDTVSSSRGGADAYRDVYLGGARNLVAWAPARGVRRLVYTSSTSVYGQTDGSWVDEQTPAEPAGETGRLLIDTEREFLGARTAGVLAATVLRVGGIYGPGRGHLFRQFVAGEATREPGGGRWINMIQRDDVATAVVAVLDAVDPGGLYNVVDDEPVRQGDFLGFVARELGRPLPPEAEVAGASRKRGITHKRVSNRRIKSEIGWRPLYPDFRRGYSEEIRRIREGG